MTNRMILSPKHKDFLKHKAPVEILEGTTACGKTTVGAFKFITEVMKSNKKLHILSGLDLGTIEKNIINKDLGILDVFDGHVEYNASGKGDYSLSHLVVTNYKGEEKIVYVVGYDNKAKWKKVLGGQYGCIMIDEINVADMDYIREISMRNDYMLATLNPDDPDLEIYDEYINVSRPVEKYASDVPEEIADDLRKVTAKEGWTYWFMSFDDNLGLDEEKKKKIINSVVPGTKQYKNKILGLRGRSEGLCFDLQDYTLLYDFEIRKLVDSRKVQFEYFTLGVDTSYSRKTDDVIAFVFDGITTTGDKYSLEEVGFNNRDLIKEGKNALAPSDIAPLLFSFADRCVQKWGMPHGIYIDSADSATNTECEKYKREKGLIYSIAPSYKNVSLLDRIMFEQGWMTQRRSFISRNCKGLIKERNSMIWKANKQEPEDKNDHYTNAEQYAWIPYKERIGV